ncbi:DivIVA domain-containing protein [Enterococcus hulanensis]|uniref:DivIVA domain-containing protein n=1 Tax=Enterococcus hulanensis TaxID=2559929 RepID=UPI002891595C|nr:DivIVA domain-containing protein [Enterococcus hulanensis]MDT2662977.1 DivIVA domain-containing protein [Enterococcus hulanensis]
MKFSIQDIKNLTFPNGAMGYKKKDVDDFLGYVAKDYHSYQQQIKNLKADLEEAIAEKEIVMNTSQHQRRFDQEKLEELLNENRILKKQLTAAQIRNRSAKPKETVELSLSQKVALKLESQAQDEAKKIREEADAYYKEQMNQLQQERQYLDWKVQTSLTELVKNERMVFSSVEQLKQEYLQLVNYLRSNFDNLGEEQKKEQKVQ